MAWLRKGDEEHDGCVVVLCNGTGEGEKKVEVGKEHAGEKWTDVLGWHQGEVTIDEGKSYDQLSAAVTDLVQRAGLRSSRPRRVSRSGQRRTLGAAKSSRRTRYRIEHRSYGT